MERSLVMAILLFLSTILNFFYCFAFLYVRLLE